MNKLQDPQINSAEGWEFGVISVGLLRELLRCLRIVTTKVFV